MTDFFELGRVIKPQGIRGEIKLLAYTADPSRLAGLPHVYVKDNGGYRKLAVRSARTDAKAAYILLEGIDGRDAAETLRGTVFYIDREHAAPLPEGAHYIADLVGARVALHGGEALGTLKEIIQAGAADVYVVALNGGGQCMFPSAPGVFVSRDVENGLLTVDPVRFGEVAVYDSI